MDPTGLPKIVINWKREGRKTRGRPRRTWRDGICTAMGERDLRMGEWNDGRQWNVEVGRREDGRVERWKAVECGSWKASPGVLKPRNK